MLFQNLKAIGEELSEICVLFCNYIYIFIYIDDSLIRNWKVIAKLLFHNIKYLNTSGNVKTVLKSPE
jgi:hypothetical protein